MTSTLHTCTHCGKINVVYLIESAVASRRSAGINRQSTVDSRQSAGISRQSTVGSRQGGAEGQQSTVNNRQSGSRYEYDCLNCDAFNQFKPVLCIEVAGELPDRAICAVQCAAELEEEMLNSER